MSDSDKQIVNLAEDIMSVIDDYRKVGLCYATVIGAIEIIKSDILEEMNDDEEFEGDDREDGDDGDQGGGSDKPSQDTDGIPVHAEYAEAGPPEVAGSCAGATPNPTGLLFSNPS